MVVKVETLEPILMVFKSLDRAIAESSLSRIVPLVSPKVIPDLLDQYGYKVPPVIGMELDVLPARLFFSYQKVFEAVKVHRNPLLILAIFFFLTGIQFVLFGLIGELIIRTYHESQGKPTYLVREEESPDKPDSASGLERAESG